MPPFIKHLPPLSGNLQSSSDDDSLSDNTTLSSGSDTDDEPPMLPPARRWMIPLPRVPLRTVESLEQCNLRLVVYNSLRIRMARRMTKWVKPNERLKNIVRSLLLRMIKPRVLVAYTWPRSNNVATDYQVPLTGLTGVKLLFQLTLSMIGHNVSADKLVKICRAYIRHLINVGLVDHFRS